MMIISVASTYLVRRYFYRYTGSSVRIRRMTNVLWKWIE